MVSGLLLHLLLPHLHTGLQGEHVPSQYLIPAATLDISSSLIRLGADVIGTHKTLLRGGSPAGSRFGLELRLDLYHSYLRLC